ncbi:MAG: hypothetical protein KGH53_03110 [Candidatus Micrarchaeota archaeon]|nr:hypothetical protein [Candidatus Micrarchaeota archaeon]
MAKKPSSKKKLEMLRRTQEVTEIVERGNIEEQAMSDSASSQGVSDEGHVEDLLTNVDSQDFSPKNKSAPKKASKKSTPAKKSRPKRR